jgi:hypothetical protein
LGASALFPCYFLFRQKVAQKGGRKNQPEILPAYRPRYVFRKIYGSNFLRTSTHIGEFCSFDGSRPLEKARNHNETRSPAEKFLCDVACVQAPYFFSK